MKNKKGVRIIAKTKKGIQALKQHIQDKKKESFMQRRAFDGLYKETIESENPFTISLVHKNERVSNLIPYESMTVPINEALKTNGATVKIDYVLEKIDE